MASSSSRLPLVAGLAVCIAAAGAWFWWQRQAQPPAPPPAPAPAARTAPEPAAPPAPEYGAPVAAPAPLEAKDVPAAVQALLGPAGGAKLLELDDFARRVVATIDNLGREHAPSQVWPVQKASGKFDVDGGAISAANAARYAPYVELLERIDTARATELYARLYPLLQAAYRQLGFPQGEFNTRLVRVLDLLLAAPEPQGPIEVQLVEVKGPVQPQQPWTRYEFRDPQLEALPAGQKIMVRIGRDHERRVKARLRELRAAIVAASTRTRTP